MGYKAVCLNCRKAFNIASYYDGHVPEKCPECSGPLALFNHKFRPPKQTDIKSWQLVAFLYQHGFNYQHIETEMSGGVAEKLPVTERYIKYPENLKDAKVFVEKYKTQARKPD